jgi:WD repeat and SOF domain-containing protein 1
MFAQPFVAAFEGHADSVTCLERVPGVLSAVASASHDGGRFICCFFPSCYGGIDVLPPVDIIVHQIAQRVQVAKFSGAHKGKVSALSMADGLEGVDVGKRLLSCGHDNYIKMWRLPLSSELDEASASNKQPIMVYAGKAPFK